MKEYAKRPENQYHTLDSKPKASKQASIDIILLQSTDNKRYISKEDDELMQGKFDTVQLKVKASTTIGGVLQRTREDVQKLLPQVTDLKTVLADTSLNIHYRCTLLLINNYRLAQTDENYIKSTEEIKPEMILARGDVEKDPAFKYYWNFIINPTLPSFLTGSQPKAPQEQTDMETPRDKILRALYEHGGFIQLEDDYTTGDTEEKFGLKKEDFDRAFKNLWDEKVVAPFKEKSPVSKPGTISGTEKTGEPDEGSELAGQPSIDLTDKKTQIPPKVGLKLNKTGGTSLSPILGDETEINKNNSEKIQLYLLFGKAMEEIGIHVFLIGGAAAIILGESGRKINDLDFKTNSLPQPFNKEESQNKIKEINKIIHTTFPKSVINDFEMNKGNIHAIDGKIDSVDITIGRFMNPVHFTQYEAPENFLISSTDLLLDKAESFIFRKNDDKKTVDLFDLVWILHKLDYTFDRLYELLKKRKSFYDDEKKFLKEKDGYAEKLEDEFKSRVASFLSMGSNAIHNLFLSHVKNKAQIRIVEDMLSENFPVVFGKNTPKGKLSLIIQAGNMTGDMFGVSAAMILNPLAHVLIIYEESERDKHEMIRDFYRRSIPNERIHLMKTENMSVAYTTYSGRQNKKQLPYVKVEPEIPAYLRSPSLQYPLSEATNQVATFYDAQSQEKIKKAWLDEDESLPLKYEDFMTKKKIPLKEVKYAVLWSRYSGKKGGPHLQHDTSFRGMQQLISLARGAGYVVLIAGDKPTTKRPDKFDLLIDEGVFDLTEFWHSSLWTDSGLKSDRPQQLGFFEYLKTKGEVKHLGFRSGNLEAFALMGQTVAYMEEAGNLQKGRMEAWHGVPIGYNRIQIDLPPTFTGRYIVTKIKKEGLSIEPKPEWRAGSEKRKCDFGEPTRGFEEADLEAINKYLTGFGPVPSKKSAKKPKNESQKKRRRKTFDSSTPSVSNKNVPDNGVSANYLYPANRQVTVFETMGDGSCGIHAMYGVRLESSGHTVFQHNNAQSVRKDLSIYMLEHTEALKPRYTGPLAEIIREIYIKIIDKKSLSTNESLLWTLLSQEFPVLEKSMQDIVDTEKRLSANLNQARNDLIKEIITRSANPDGDKLIPFFINEFETSTSEADKVCKTALANKQSLEEKWAVISISDRLPIMIEINLDKILKLIDPHTLHTFDTYQTSKLHCDENSGQIKALVETNFYKLFKAYIQTVRDMTYFLRQEDLLSLADMKNEGLIIYREHDITPGSAVEALSYASDRPTVRRIFHQGIHYEHAELKDIDTE